MAHGKGVFVRANKVEKYEGDWKEDLKDGQGKETFADGSVYTGAYIKGKKAR